GVTMKWRKCLLLSSAAGLAAAAGAQTAGAADLPVKAKPVEYVKICSLYGDGFYYVPGPELCVRFAGNAQYDVSWGDTNSGAAQPSYVLPGGAHTRETFLLEQKARGDFDVDTRTQTAYGTLRSFIRLRIDVTNGQADSSTSPALPRSFIQWAGWTFGRVKSLSDIPALGDDGARRMHQTQNHNDTGANGNTEVSYTWELGNGMALHVGAGERRSKPVTNLSTVAWTGTANPTSSIAGQVQPNPYVAFKIAQVWGRWDTSVTANVLRANSYAAPPPGFVGCVGANAGTTWCDHPSDDWGFAVASGLVINAPWIAPGDIFGFYGQYGQGATTYATGNNFTSPGLFAGGNNVAIGAVTDAVYLNGTGFERTTAWSAGTYFTHYWTPQFTSTIFADYSEISYNDTVKNGRWFCAGPGAVAQGILIPAATACDPGFKFWEVGTHTDWYPVPNFRFGLEFLWTQVQTAFNASQITPGKTLARPAGAYTAKDEGISSVMFRAQRQWPGGG